MVSKKEGQLVPYNLVSPGWEAEYAGTSDLSLAESDMFVTYSADSEGNVFGKYSLWGFENLREEDWCEEIRCINEMQSQLGSIDDHTRRMRQHIGGLVCCDSGVPVTIDELLNAIGTGNLPEPAFHAGCWISTGMRSTQPHQAESMILIEDVLKGFLNGYSEDEFMMKYPYAKGFIKRTYEWLNSAGGFSELQNLLMKRMLLHFEFLTKRSEDIYAVYNDCMGEGGRGEKLDAQISELASLPKIYSIYKKEYESTLNSITDIDKKEIYKICGHIAGGIYELSDCHHNTFRAIENWIYGIGTLKWEIPTRTKSAEKDRLGQLLFSYALGLDRWLQGVPLQFLLLDLGHIDLGFDPKNEILRVYAYLGDTKTPVNTWLAACMWYTLTLNPNASLNTFGDKHTELIEHAKGLGISVRTWMDSVLEESCSSSED